MGELENRTVSLPFLRLGPDSLGRRPDTFRALDAWARRGLRLTPAFRLRRLLLDYSAIPPSSGDNRCRQ